MILIAFVSFNAVFAFDENATDTFIQEPLTDESIGSSQTLDDDSLTVDYSEIENYNSTSVLPGKVTKRYNGVVEYSATFLDENGTPIKDTIVYCGVDTPLLGVNATTNSKGVALFLLPVENGKHSLFLMNPVSEDFSTDTINVFDVLKGGKDYNLYFDSGKSYTLRVYGDDGKPVKAGQKVSFTVNNKKLTVKTDKNGNAKLKIDFQPGAYIITATYKNFMVANKIIIKPTLIPLTQFGSKKLSKTFKFKVKLLNNKGKLFKNKKVKIKFNKKTYFAKTNKKGIATFTLKTPLKTGKFNIVASYGKAKATAQLIRYWVK